MYLCCKRHLENNKSVWGSAGGRAVDSYFEKHDIVSHSVYILLMAIDSVVDNLERGWGERRRADLAQVISLISQRAVNLIVVAAYLRGRANERLAAKGRHGATANS